MSRPPNRQILQERSIFEEEVARISKQIRGAIFIGDSCELVFGEEHVCFSNHAAATLVDDIARTSLSFLAVLDGHPVAPIDAEDKLIREQVPAHWSYDQGVLAQMAAQVESDESIDEEDVMADVYDAEWHIDHLNGFAQRHLDGAGQEVVKQALMLVRQRAITPPLDYSNPAGSRASAARTHWRQRVYSILQRHLDRPVKDPKQESGLPVKLNPSKAAPLIEAITEVVTSDEDSAAAIQRSLQKWQKEMRRKT